MYIFHVLRHLVQCLVLHFFLCCIQCNQHLACYVFITGHRTYFPFWLIFLSQSSSLRPTQIISDCFLPFFLSLITPISDQPLYYLVVLCLSPYQCLPSYHVRYIGSQSGGTVGFGLCPLHLVTLFAQVLQQYIRCTIILLGP